VTDNDVLNIQTQKTYSTLTILNTLIDRYETVDQNILVAMVAAYFCTFHCSCMHHLSCCITNVTRKNSKTKDFHRFSFSFIGMIATSI
jgi:hypothetical protein